MPKHSNISKVLVIGSGAIIIGQAAEFDYAGTQACQALKEDNIEVVLVNSNPATIMTDTNIADKVYIEPLQADVLKRIIEREKPDSILPTLGGQTALNLAMELAETKFLEEKGINLLGTSVEAIKMAEDRQAFKDVMESIGEPCIVSKVVSTVEDAEEFAEEIGYPVIIRPAYTLGGSGGGIVNDVMELREIACNGLRLSRVTQILVEKCISGWKEVEYEIVRDSAGNVVTVCNMENIDPVGVHTGDSIVVAPSQTLSDKEYQMLRSASLRIISALKVEGGCNVQFALNVNSFEYAVIEVNPRVSRSSALASKATGYPIARVATKIAIGYRLDEIKNMITGKTYVCFEPALDYVVVKIPKWPFDKFVNADRNLGTQMKATGEVMAISNSFEAAFMKAVRSLELGLFTLEQDVYSKMDFNEIKRRLEIIDDVRIFVIAEAIRRNIHIDELNKITNIDIFFLHKIKNLVMMEERLKQLNGKFSPDQFGDVLCEAKKLGFVDSVIAKYVGITKDEIATLREKQKCQAVYKMVDTCAAEFEALTPYYYSTYDKYSEVQQHCNQNILIMGSGPIRIGQGIEFDYCSVRCVWALKEEGYYTVIVNNNPETVSTDFDTADRLYFEPLTEEDVKNIVRVENPIGAIVQFGGQTAIKLAKSLKSMGVNILGTTPENIDIAEDREKFDSMLEELGILRPKGKTVTNLAQALDAAETLGYPVIVRPSYVLGGQGMEIAYSPNDVTEFMNIICQSKQEHPILVDKYIMGKEIEVDAICDGSDILIPGIMEHLERTGIHSGDSISVYPTQTISDSIKETIVEYTYKLAMALKIVGLINIQYILFDNQIYVIEVNPRASRTVPYMSKVTGIPIVDIATKVMIGKKLSDFEYGTGLYRESDFVSVKVPVFSFEKLLDLDTSLGPEMKSTGEVLGISRAFSEALYKGIVGSGIKLPEKEDGILLTVNDSDKIDLIPIAKEFKALGFKLYATNQTTNILLSHGIDAIKVEKIGSGQYDILDLIESGGVSLVINTPTKGRKPERDGFKIRRKAVERSISCLTSLDTARAVLDCLKLKEVYNDLGVVELGDLRMQKSKNFVTSKK